MKILVTGGTGFIGSHTVVELLQAGHEVVVLDNLENSKKEVVACIQEICGKSFPFVKADIRHKSDVKALFSSHPDISAVIHFAAFKAVGESVEQPLKYYENN